MVWLLLATSVVLAQSDCTGDQPLAIPTALGSQGDVLTSLLFKYGMVYNLQPRETITCEQLLNYAPLVCEDIQVRAFCCSSCETTYEQCCSDEKLRFAMLNTSFDAAWTFDENGIGNARWKGMVPDYLEELSLLMGFNYTYVPTPFTAFVSGTTLSNNDVDLSFTQVHSFFYNRHALSYPVSRPILVFQHGIVIRKLSHGGGYWRIFSPFTTQLWVLICAGIITSGGIFWLVESRYANDMKRTPAGVMGAAYFAITTLLVGGEGYEVVTWLGRLLRIGTLFFVLIVNSTYTAELASILTQESRTVDGPTTLEAAKQTRVCCLLGRSEPSCISDMWVEPPFSTIGTPAALEFCVNALKTDVVDGIQADEFTIAAIVAKNCDDFMLSGVNLQPKEFSFVASPNNTHFIPLLNGAMAFIRTSDKFREIQDRHYPQPCVGGEQEEGELVVDVTHMSGLFIIFACFCVLVILLFLIRSTLETLGVWEGRTLKGEVKQNDMYDSPTLPNEESNAPVTKEEIAMIFANQRKIMQTLTQLQKDVIPKAPPSQLHLQ